MGMINRALWIMSALLAVACSHSVQREAPNQSSSESVAEPLVEGTPLELFKPNPNWQLVEDVVADGTTLKTTQGQNNTILVNGEGWAKIGRASCRERVECG